MKGGRIDDSRTKVGGSNQTDSDRSDKTYYFINTPTILFWGTLNEQIRKIIFYKPRQELCERVPNAKIGNKQKENNHSVTELNKDINLATKRRNHHH